MFPIPLFNYDNDVDKHWLNINQIMKEVKVTVSITDVIKRDGKRTLDLKYSDGRYVREPGVYSIWLRETVENVEREKCVYVGSNSKAFRNTIANRVLRFFNVFSYCSSSRARHSAAEKLRVQYDFDAYKERFYVKFVTLYDLMRLEIPTTETRQIICYVEDLFHKKFKPTHNTIKQSKPNRRRNTAGPHRAYDTDFVLANKRSVFDYV